MTAAEAHIDRIYDIVEEFEGRLAGRGICNDTQPEHQEHLVHLFLSGLESDGFTAQAVESIADELDALVRPHGWFVAKRATLLDPGAHHASDPQRLGYIDVFPLLGASQKVPGTVYHVAPRELRSAIAAEGLKPGFGGTDHITTPDARLYVALHLLVAEELVADMERLRGQREYDIWRIALTDLPDLDWRRDVEMVDLSAWTRQTLPADRLELLQG